jgi:hypothetical protein
MHSNCYTPGLTGLATAATLLLMKAQSYGLLLALCCIPTPVPYFLLMALGQKSQRVPYTTSSCFFVGQSTHNSDRMGGQSYLCLWPRRWNERVNLGSACLAFNYLFIATPLHHSPSQHSTATISLSDRSAYLRSERLTLQTSLRVAHPIAARLPHDCRRQPMGSRCEGDGI